MYRPHAEAIAATILRLDADRAAGRITRGSYRTRLLGALARAEARGCLDDVHALVTVDRRAVAA
jgi:hypothetical protein